MNPVFPYENLPDPVRRHVIRTMNFGEQFELTHTSSQLRNEVKSCSIKILMTVRRSTIEIGNSDFFFHFDQNCNDPTIATRDLGNGKELWIASKTNNTWVIKPKSERELTEGVMTLVAYCNKIFKCDIELQMWPGWPTLYSLWFSDQTEKLRVKSAFFGSDALGTRPYIPGAINSILRKLEIQESVTLLNDTIIDFSLIAEVPDIMLSPESISLASLAISKNRNMDFNVGYEPEHIREFIKMWKDGKMENLENAVFDMRLDFELDLLGPSEPRRRNDRVIVYKNEEFDARHGKDFVRNDGKIATAAFRQHPDLFYYIVLFHVW